MAHLNNVKDAWRNPTMHSKHRYTQEEGQTILDNVTAFITHLANRVF